MPLLHRDAWPRWARGATSPWLISPLLVVALAIGGFTAYGAWTRAHPTHYARGGDTFGVDSLTTTPSAGATTHRAHVGKKGAKHPAGKPGKPRPGAAKKRGSANTVAARGS